MQDQRDSLRMPLLNTVIIERPLDNQIIVPMPKKKQVKPHVFAYVRRIDSSEAYDNIKDSYHAKGYKVDVSLEDFEFLKNKGIGWFYGEGINWFYEYKDKLNIDFQQWHNQWSEQHDEIANSILDKLGLDPRSMQ